MIKLGILNAVTASEEDEFGEKEHQVFINFFDLTPNEIELIEYRVAEGHFPQSVAECDAYLITGSPKGAYDLDPWIAQLQDFIRDVYAAQRKMVGICFGHQVLAHALGGKAEKSEKGWGLGMGQVEFVEKRPFMSPSIENGNLYFCHQDQVVQLPPKASRLAGNEFCPNGMFVIDDYVLGIQAHPEFTPEINQKAIDWFESHSPEQSALIQEAQKSSDDNHNHIISNWIVNFIQR
ncbi:MAG: hypothetical protein AAF490_22750 [Chloroflexota bacterium]